MAKIKHTEIRDGIYHFSRRVPARVAAYDRRRFVRVSLNTRDPAEAAQKAAVQNKILENYWAELVRLKKVHGDDERWADAITLAKAHGFTYRALDEIVDLPVFEILDRLTAAKKRGISERTGNAFLGGIGRPKTNLSKCVDIYFELMRHELSGRDKEFIHKWKKPKARAFNALIDVVGDKDLADVGRQDILDFQAHWKDMVIDGLKTGTANKYMQLTKAMLGALFIHKQIDIDVDELFKKVKFKEERRQRTPFEAAFVRDKILPNLSGLTADARALIYVMAETGARPNEIIGLRPEDIILDGIPHIWIRPNEKRRLKNASSERKIPLVGVALKYIKVITRYQRADSASALINKYFAAHGMKPTDMHTLYSLRHTFEDRLKDAKVSDIMRKELMGHSTGKYHYGRGFTLEAKHEALQGMVFQISRETKGE